MTWSQPRNDNPTAAIVQPHSSAVPAAERRSLVARGVSPWNRAITKPIAPEGRS